MLMAESGGRYMSDNRKVLSTFPYDKNFTIINYAIFIKYGTIIKTDINISMICYFSTFYCKFLFTGIMVISNFSLL